MDEDDIRRLAAELPGAEVVVAGPDDGSPELAWGDTFCYAASAAEAPRDRTQPFATIVTKDYPGFDEASQLDRPGVFRLNIGLGRTGFAELLDSPPAAGEADAEEVDPTALDTWLPHPVYAPQGWVSILNPGSGRVVEVVRLLAAAQKRARPTPR